MVRHIVLWSFKETMTKDEKEAAAARMKSELEAIKELVSGAVEIKVIKNEMDSSNRDIALVSIFDSTESLKKYQEHPAHIEAGKFVRSVTENRACLDYEV